jgi:hypothetical protein
MMDDEYGYKWVSAARLMELLATLPADSRVMPNAVDNLCVLTADGATYLGFIDLLLDGEVNLETKRQQL